MADRVKGYLIERAGRQHIVQASEVKAMASGDECEDIYKKGSHVYEMMELMDSMAFTLENAYCLARRWEVYQQKWPLRGNIPCYDLRESCNYMDGSNYKNTIPLERCFNRCWGAERIAALSDEVVDCLKFCGIADPKKFAKSCWDICEALDNCRHELEYLVDSKLEEYEAEGDKSKGWDQKYDSVEFELPKHQDLFDAISKIAVEGLKQYKAMEALQSSSHSYINPVKTKSGDYIGKFKPDISWQEKVTKYYEQRDCSKDKKGGSGKVSARG